MSAPTPDVSEKLIRLAELVEKGLLTREEYTEQKHRLLSAQDAPSPSALPPSPVRHSAPSTSQSPPRSSSHHLMLLVVVLISLVFGGVVFAGAFCWGATNKLEDAKDREVKPLIY